MPTLRRDAQRNRDRLIATARELFAERGLDVALEEVARTAGVSIGTLYNRFPSRRDLVDAVFADREATVIRLTEASLAMADPWDGFAHFVEQICRLLAADRGFGDLAARRAAAPLPRGHELMTRLIVRAQEAGELRADFTLADMAFVTWSITRTIEATATTRPDAWRRHLAFLFDGLRAGAAHPLPVPALSEHDLG